MAIARSRLCRAYRPMLGLMRRVFHRFVEDMLSGFRIDKILKLGQNIPRDFFAFLNGFAWVIG